VPSSSTDFLYSLMALLAVGVILTASFSSYTTVLAHASEVSKLKEVVNHVAAKATEALTFVTENNATLSIVFSLPLKIGDRDYWIRFANDSSSAWVEGAFGNASRSGEQDCRVYLPRDVYATGTFEGGYELAQIDCSLNGSTIQLTLSRKE